MRDAEAMRRCEAKYRAHVHRQLEPRTQNETWTHDCLDDTLIAIFRGETTRCVLIRRYRIRECVVKRVIKERAPPDRLRLNVQVSAKGCRFDAAGHVSHKAQKARRLQDG